MEWLNDTSSNNLKLGRLNLEKLLVSLSVLAPHMASDTRSNYLVKNYKIVFGHHMILN